MAIKKDEHKITATIAVNDNVIKCSRCKTPLVKTGGGHSGIDYHCNKCGLNETRVK